MILTGIGLPDDGLHSPNEKLDLQQLWEGVAVFGRFYELLAGTRREPKPRARRKGLVASR